MCFFVVGCFLLFVDYCWWFVVRCLASCCFLFVVCCLVYVVCCVLLCVCGVLFNARCRMLFVFVVCCFCVLTWCVLLFVVLYVLILVC